jgi:hypothetical protein
LKEGDVVRFGRIPFKIVQLVLTRSNAPVIEDTSMNKSVSADDLPSQRL